MASQESLGPVPTATGCRFYEYQPLPLNDEYIRQLILGPGQGNDPLSGSLVTTKLPDAPGFEAISYVWGASIRDRWIVIDGRQLPITTSMEDALRHARMSDKQRTLWADSICMNQEDNVEKAHQVTMMGRIYARSSRTLICLGLDPQSRQYSRDVVALVDGVNNMMDRTFASPEFSWDWESFPFPREDEPLLHDEKWISWEKLGKCDWFRRGWVVQEAALAREAVVLWADAEIQWISILRTYEWLVQRVLNAARTLDVSEPKDGIYAFMSMPTSDKVFADLDIKPDYRKDISHLDVYRDFAVRYLHKTRDLDLLSYVEHGDSDLDNGDEADGLQLSSLFLSFPSWIPRWDRGLPLIRGVAYWLNVTVPKIEINSNFTSNTPTINGGSIIQANAIILDSIQYVSKIVSWSDTRNAPEYIQEVVSLWREVAPQSTKYPGPHQDTALNKSLAFLTALCRSFFDGEYDEFWESLKAFARLLQDDRPTSSIETYLRNKEARRISTFAIKSSQSRRFILLSRGHYGIAPRTTRSGDTCAVIPGTRFPFILRKVASKEDHYLVVGRAYVQSKTCSPTQTGHPLPLARSDKSRDWEDWGLQTQRISLC
ncbi:hypothetical protein INS49_005916 [Diaporthe citri]|uniref:uncharacterized protein n=1 Tax=Diaporthe citri TaxID=83186 RepID=UPI001C801F3C|nr:uncharacterized protein INS49_005916 [Diaporthe citri]KAG6364316.1 hypothetical protein INS49_005916 [Diaporthe citri]